VQGGPGAVVPLYLVLGSLKFGWVVAVSASVIGFLAGLLMPAGAVIAGAAYERGTARSGLGRELLTVVALAVVLSGLMLRPSEAEMLSNQVVLIVLVVGGLLLAGPVLTRLLVRIPTPTWFGRP